VADPDGLLLEEGILEGMALSRVPRVAKPKPAGKLRVRERFHSQFHSVRKPRPSTQPGGFDKLKLHPNISALWQRPSLPYTAATM
jgi:hypothetical protein